MNKILRGIWNNPVVAAGVIEGVVLVPDLPGPRWLWGVVAAVAVLGARAVVDGPVTRAR